MKPNIANRLPRGVGVLVLTASMVGSVTLLPTAKAAAVTILSPTNGAAFAALTDIIVEAAVLPDVTNVLFVINSGAATNSLSATPCPPVSVPENACLTLTKVAAGTHQVTAIATDNLGTKATNSVTILVYVRPVLSSPVRGPAGKFRFDITSKAGQSILVQASPDQAAWLDLRTVIAPADKFTFMDESATNINLRFYRTRTP